MDLPNWLYILRDKSSGQYIYLDTTNNVISYTTTPTALVYTPDGWQKKSIAWERDLTKFGLVRTFTVSLNFVRDGKTIIDRVAVQQGFETPIELLIQKLNLNTTVDPAVFSYVDFYVGEINLSALESEEIYVSAPIVEGGVAKALKANEETVYELDLDTDPDVVKVNHDGAKLFSGINYIVTPLTVDMGSAADSRYTPVGYTTRDGDAPGVAAFQVFDGEFGNPTDVNNTNYFLADTQPVDFRISGKIRAKLHGAVDPGVRFEFVLLSNLHPTFIAYLNPGGNIITGPPTIGGITPTQVNGEWFIEFDFDKSFSGTANESFFLKTHYVGNSGTFTFTAIEYLQTDFRVDFGSRYKTTTTKGLTAYTVFKRLVGRITGSETNAQSTLLAGLENLVITSGDAVRGLPGSKIKTSMADFFKFARVVCFAGMSIENEKITIESLPSFCSVASPVDLGECRGFKWKFAEELLFNRIKIGYDSKSSSNTDNVNGKYSFNNSHTYLAAIKSIDKQLELVCPYVADPFYIEIIRMNLEGKTTTDNQADSDVIILNTENGTGTAYTANLVGPFFGDYFILLHGAAGDISKFSQGVEFEITGDPSNNGTYTSLGCYLQGSDLVIIVGTPVVNQAGVSITIIPTAVNLKRDTYVSADQSVTGVPDITTLYNIVYLTPKQIAIRWKPYFNSCLFQFAGTTVSFETTEKSRDLYFETVSGVIVDEDSNFTITAERIFKGVYYNFECTVDDVVPETLNTSPNTGFKTTNPVNGKVFKGILIKAAMAAEEMTAQSFRLLAGPNEDENNLLA